MPCDYQRDYNSNFRSEVVLRIRARAHDRCERCLVKNHAVGFRDPRDGAFWEEDGDRYIPDFVIEANHRLLTIVCTVAHLNHDSRDDRDENLAFLCQRCHLAHDREHHMEKAKRTRAGGPLLTDGLEVAT